MTPTDYVLGGVVVLCGLNAAGLLLAVAIRTYYERKARRRRLARHPHANGMQHSARSLKATTRRDPA